MLVYKVDFRDGAVKQYAANVIAMHILSQVDSDGQKSKTLYLIVDYKRDNSAVFKASSFLTINRGVRKLSQMKIG